MTGRLPRSRLRASVEVRNQVSHPLCLDSGRSSNRHVYPSVNTSRFFREQSPRSVFTDSPETASRTTTGLQGPIVRLETAKGCHKVFDLAGRGGFAGFEGALNA